MKKQFIISLFSLLLVSNASAQIKESRMFDEITNFCCESTRARLDVFFLEIQNNPDAKGHLIFYGGKNHPLCGVATRIPKRGEIEAIKVYFKNHVKFRNQDPNRFNWINGGYRETWTAELWIVPNNATLPKSVPTLTEKEIKFKRGKIKKFDLGCP